MSNPIRTARCPIGKALAGSFLPVCLVLVSIASGCSSAVDKVVDREVTRMVDAENKKLPAEVRNGIQLTRLVYDPALNQLRMKYIVEDRDLFVANSSKIESATHKRVRSNESLKRAFKNGIRVFHDFYLADPGESGEGDITGSPFKSFETKQ